MNEGGFYKTSRAMLRRKDMTDAAKIIQVVRTHFLAFEGREPTTAELVAATGKCERTVRRAKADKLSGPKRTKCPAKMSAQAVNSSAPSCSTSHGSVRDVDKGERGTAPIPLASQGEKANGKTQCPNLGPQASSLFILAAKARMGGGKWPFEQWAGQVEEDTAARRYRRADLEAFVASRTAITEAPWKLAESVRRHAAAAKAAAFRERLRTIRAEGLSDARLGGDKRRWRVRYVDEGDGLLILEESLPEPAPPALEELERQLRQCERRCWPTEPLSERIEAIRAGRPDPHPEPRGEPEKKEIRTPDDMRGWTFRPYQPRLFE